MEILNSYEDDKRAQAYAKLEFPGTYYLAYRDLPAIMNRHAAGKRALDFGCGAGRSTRFMRQYGFDAAGVDISRDMIDQAKHIDPAGDYRLMANGDFSAFEPDSFDLVLSAFTFDNIPTKEMKIKILTGIAWLLKPEGRMVNLVSSPDMYINEWASFSTRDYPENRHAKSGDRVRIIITDIDDRRPVEDIVWSDEDYRDIYARSGLEVEAAYKPLAEGNEPYRWVTETRKAPWVIYVLKRAGGGGGEL